MDYTADFETTTRLDDCRVWAWATCTIDDENTVTFGNSIDSFIASLKDCPGSDFWFHNLAFDGEFIISHLLKSGWMHVDKAIKDKQFSTLISSSGKFYQITLCFGRNKKVHIKDSLKKLTMSVAAVAKAFGLPISKLELDYDTYREPGHVLTEHERAYIENDVKIMAMALGRLFSSGAVKLTAGADALAQYKDTIGPAMWKRLFPVLNVEMDAAIRRAYKGGWTYANPLHAADAAHPDRCVGAGSVYDKNSMYPSVMYSEALPVGVPVYFRGEYEFDAAYPLYIQYLQCSIKIKPDHLPTIQVKNNPYFIETEYITDSEGVIELALTNIDLELMREQYDVDVIQYLGGYKFKAMKGMFCEYIDYWMKVKENSTGGMRLLAKLMLNSLYGKFATNPDVTPKVPYLKDDGAVGYKLGDEETRDPVYTPMGCFITAYARADIVRNCQAVYGRFLYADTDSIHCLGTEPLNLDYVHPTHLGAWKHESDFDKAKYLRAKTYAENITHVGAMEDGKYSMVPVDPYLDVKCCGCPENLRGVINFDNFKRGLKIHGKLRPKHVDGGIVLVETDFTLK